MTIVVTGKNSLIGREMQKRFQGPGWLFMSHDEALADTSWIHGATCIINFALSPNLRTRPYSSDDDIDLKLAHLIQNKTIHYIMMSSRLVYGAGGRLCETDTPTPHTIYAQNKLETEKNLTDILNDRLTILRGANVFGHEYGRKSFFGMALGNLHHKGQIIFDMNPDVERDFIAAWHVAKAIANIAIEPSPGIFNLGSGYGTRCRDIATWIIEGYGSGEIISSSPELRDEFYMDMTKTNATFDVDSITPEIMRGDCQSCGKALQEVVL